MSMRFGILGLALLVAQPLADDGDGDKKPASDRTPQGGEVSPPSLNGSGSNLLQDLKIDFEPGNGLTFEKDGLIKLQIRQKAMVRWEYADRGLAGVADTNTIRLRSPRTYFDGYLYSNDLTYRISLDWDETRPPKDIYMDWRFYKTDDYQIGLRLGQQKPLFGRVATASLYSQEFVDRDLATTTFANTRSRGANLHGKLGASGIMHWNVGVFTADTAAGFPYANEEANINAGPLADNELNYVINLRFDPQGDMGGTSYSAGDLERADHLKTSIGGGLFIGNERVLVPATTPNTATDVEILSWNLNAAAKLNGFHLLGEVFLRQDKIRNVSNGDVDSWGYNAQLSYTTEPDKDQRQWGLAARVAHITLVDSVTFSSAPAYSIPGLGNAPGVGSGTKGEAAEVTLGLSRYYKKHNMKSQLDFTWRHVQPDAGTSGGGVPVDVVDWIVRLQFTIQI